MLSKLHISNYSLSAGLNTCNLPLSVKLATMAMPLNCSLAIIALMHTKTLCVNRKTYSYGYDL